MLPELSQQPIYPRRTRGVIIGSICILLFVPAILLGATWLAASQLYMLAAAIRDYFNLEERRESRWLSLPIIVRLIICVVLTILAVIAGIAVGRLLADNEPGLLSTLGFGVLASGVILASGTLAYYAVLPRLHRR
jgi:hypothetical protein